MMFNSLQRNWQPHFGRFCDASRLAFGACAYTRWKVVDGIECDARLVAASSRVSPLKELTIPRLELQPAFTVTHLSKSIIEESPFNFESPLSTRQPCHFSLHKKEGPALTNPLSRAEFVKFS